MTTSTQRTSAGDSRKEPLGRASLVRAWVALALVPLAFIAAFVLAEVLYAATGHDPSSETPPHWADAVALIPAGLVFVAPCVVAVVSGLRAVTAGRRAGYVPASIAVLVALGYTVLNLL